MAATQRVKILILDIETAPNAAHVWGLWQQNIATNQITASGYVLCWAAKWFGKRDILFQSVQHSKTKAMLQTIHTLLTEADIVIHYNGLSFDIPTLNKEFAIHGFLPPEPYKQVDMLQVVRKAFRFPSNKLDYIVQALKLGAKVRHPGHEMWIKCMSGDKAAWATMQRYNKHDVIILERLYHRLRPWIKAHPNVGAFVGKTACTNCGSLHISRRGIVVTKLRQFQQFQCQDCGSWMRASTPERCQAPKLVS